MISLGKSFRAARLRWLFGVTLGCAASSARAQDAPTATPATPITASGEQSAATNESAEKPRRTFQDALAKARFSGGIALVVDAQNEARSPEDIENAGSPSVVHAAEAFGKTIHWFGGVMAIGPQTYTELASDFTGANPFADMPPTEAFTLLLASLSDGQRNALASKAGMGYGDLTTPTQKHIFQVLLPDQEVKVWPRGLSEGDKHKDLGVLRDNPGSVHIRIAQQVRLQCEVKNQQYGSVDVQALDSPPGTTVYDMNSWQHYHNLDKINGVVIRRQVPNRLKRSDLNYDAPALQTAVSIKDVKTVGDLIERVAKRTRIELIAENVYEKKTLTLISDGKESASASELLRALAFSLAASYRKVGTAFTLTDDLVGVGTRKQIIRDFEEECEAERTQAVKDAEKAIKETPAQKKLKLDSFGDPQAMTAEQEKAPAPNQNYHLGLAEIAAPRDELTAAQQGAVQKFEAHTKAHPEEYSPEWSPDFSKNIHVVKDFAVQFLVSGVDGVIATDFGAELSPLFEKEKKKPEIPAEQLKMFENLPRWTDAVKPYARRAVICKPHTTDEVDACLLRIKAMGFNQMWLTVFEKGKARIPGTPLPLDPACAPKTDLLTYAIAQGAKQGVTICPVVNVFAWGADAPKALRLRTVRGEDSAQSALRRFKVNTLMPARGMQEFNPMPKNAAPSDAVYIDPEEPFLRSALTALFNAVAGHVGAGPIVCRAMTPEGFNTQNYNSQMRTCEGLGYNTSLRLAFLRKQRIDPVDLSDSSYPGFNLRANTSVANYDGYDYELQQKWNALRADTLKTTCQNLYETVWNSAGDSKPSLLIGQSDGQGFFSWYDDWSDPKAPLPNANFYSPPAADAKPGAAPKIPTAVLFLSRQTPSLLPKELTKYEWMDVQMKIMEFYKQLRNWDGVVIEE